MRGLESGKAREKDEEEEKGDVERDLEDRGRRVCVRGVRTRVRGRAKNYVTTP